MRNTLLLVIVILGVNFLSFGQEEGEFDPPTIIPPSPTAYELGKYGLVDVGMFTGTPNINIPLYNYTSGKLSVPISLSYNSNGIKVDQLSSNVGLGWSLNAGGVITRIVKGKSDYDNTLLYPEEDIAEYGVWSPMAMDFFYAAGNNVVDTEPDLYSYNFNGYSGKFAFTKDGGIIFMPHKDITLMAYGDVSNITGFMAIDPSGIQYEFLAEEFNINRISGDGHALPDGSTTSWYLSKIIHPSGDEIQFIYENESYQYIVSKSQSFKIPSPHMQLKSCTTYSYTSKWDIVESPVLSNNLTVSGKKLVQIKSNNPKNGIVDFVPNITHPEVYNFDLVSQINVKSENLDTIKSFDFDYLMTSNNRVFLNKVQLKDPSQKYSFEYIDPQGAPERLSFSQDHWGYYNGITNTKLYPNPQALDDFNIHADLRDYDQGGNKTIVPLKAEKGLLSKIEYPTKGYNEFIYESNSYYGTKKIYPSSKEAYLTVDTDFDTFIATDSKIITNILSNQDVDFYCNVYFNDYEPNCGDPSSYPSHHIKATITVTNLTNPSDNTFYEYMLNGYIASGNAINISPEDTKPNSIIKLKANNDYEIKLEVLKPCLRASFSMTYFEGTVQEVPDNIDLGGLRIKNITKYDPVNNKTESDRYYYGKKETIDNSSGEKGLQPFYVSNLTTRNLCEGSSAFFDLTYKLLNSSSIRTLFNSSIGTTSYQYVTISHGGDNFENGGEEHEFIVGNDYPGNPLWGEYIQSAPWTNFGWDKGLEKRVTTFKKSGTDNIISKEIINNYKQDERHSEEIKGYSVKKKFELYQTGDITYECTAVDVEKIYEYNNCVADHNHNWLAIPYGGTKCIASGHDNRTTYIPHNCFGKEVGEIILYSYNIENLDITEYKNISYWHYLDSTTVNQYDINGENSVTTATKYIYDNDQHLQLTRTQTNDSYGNIIETKMYYPEDILDETSLPGGYLTEDNLKAIDTLKYHHRINIPIQTDVTKNGTLFRKRLIYNDWIKKANSLEFITEPDTILSSKGTETLEERLVYHDYDSYGNPLEVSRADGTHIVYVWGYDHSKPIAKIENTTYSTVLNFFNATMFPPEESVTTTEQDLRDYFQTMRSAFTNSHITSYTYDPLIGVTSITDPRGETVTYHYDDFNRLEFIKDSNGHILSENKYNYKN